MTSEQADVAKGRISTTSPIGRGLLGKKVGETVKVLIPGGTREMEIITVDHDPRYRRMIQLRVRIERGRPDMTYTRAIGIACNKVIRLIVHGLALSKIHPNVLTFLGLVINIVAAVLLAAGQFRSAGLVIIGAGLFDMVDGRVARETNRVTRFGGFFDSVLDRYSDLALLMGLLVYYGNHQPALLRGADGDRNDRLGDGELHSRPR